MADPVAEFQKITVARDAAFTKLAAFEKPLLEKFNALINKRNEGETLSADEQNDLLVSKKALGSVHHGMWIVGQISLQAMEDSALLRDIKNGLNGASKDLEKAAGKLKTLKKAAQTAAEITSALVEVAQMVGKALV